ncbi:lactate utilization protein C [Nocardioides sp. BP30]|uniref:LutC/YkgG family protein n=1 Tax=Nocardioides sp. BP30 TaxID=3036374 RepID=UPI002469C1AE|nr:lactate utilization protein C [Nocardioides sp. BP30]WGL51854.1 lactate utilization protein C [Nocardioides sp. BP30]
MTAREQILARVRSALADVTDVPAAPPAPRRTPVEDVVGHFAERVADYRAAVVRSTPEDLAAAVAAAVPAGASVVVPAGLGVDVPGATVDDGSLTAADLDGIDVVVTEAVVGIAETGTIVLDHGPGQGRRAITLVPDTHVCIVTVDQVVLDVPDAVGLLTASVRQGRPLTWISGPSATSDIELSRVEGVHGPRNLHVIVVGPATGA